MHITVVILTLNEERHIARAISSVKEISDRIVVVDSGSTDRTVTIAKHFGADVLHHAFVNQAMQFNWALNQLPADTDWVLRLDADEYLESELAQEISSRLPDLGPEIHGVCIPRRMAFLGKLIRHGGLFPVWVLRVFRYGKGHCENRWMDEHILIEGKTTQFGAGELIDDNHNSLTWWTQKHNAYACREAIDILNLEHGFMRHESFAKTLSTKQASNKRWMKENIYNRLPGGLRALVYFLYRYVLKLGFLDGREGAVFHVLQGFWYRYLVDAKLLELRLYMRQKDTDAVTAVRDLFGINIKDVE